MTVEIIRQIAPHGLKHPDSRHIVGDAMLEIDDQPVIALRRHNFRHEGAWDGEEGVQRAAALCPDFPNAIGLH
nr:hypothetical protein [Paracoccus haematequi]